MRIKWNADWRSLFVLFNILIFLISSHALINAPGPFQSAIIENLEIDTYRYGILVSLCSWASLADVFHGYLLDRYLGLILATWLYNLLLVVGCALYALAGFTKDYHLMLTGRIIYGLGVNPMLLLGYKHIIRWFGSGKYVNFIYSLSESNSWFGSCIIYLVTHPLFDLINKLFTKHESFAIANAAEICFFTIFTIVPLIIAGYMYNCTNSASLDISPSETNDKTTDTPGETNSSSTDDKSKTERGKQLQLKNYICLPIIFWLFSISAFLYYLSILSFISMSVMFFKTQYKLSSSEASTLSGIISLAPTVIAPFSGLLLDKIGHNLTSFTLAVSLNVLSFGLMTWTNCKPIIPVVAMGVSLIASTGIWSQFQFLVEEHQFMIAYGVAQTGLNGAQAVGTMIAGHIIDEYGYPGYMIFQFSVIGCAVPVIILVWLIDIRRGNFLNLTSKKKNEILKRLD